MKHLQLSSAQGSFEKLPTTLSSNSNTGWVSVEIPWPSAFGAAISSLRVGDVSGRPGEPIPVPAGSAQIELNASFSSLSLLAVSRIVLQVWVVPHRITRVDLDFLGTAGGQG
jgi:hypothetical protein